MAYLEIIRIRFLTMLAYRLNFASGIFTYIIYIGGYYYLWSSIYGGRLELGGMTAIQMTTYLAISYMTRAFYFNNLDREIGDEMKSGMVAIQLIRPYHYLVGKLTGAFGEGLFRLLFWMLPGMAVATLLFHVEWPPEGRTYSLFVLAAMLAFLLNSLINISFGLLTFYLHNSQGMLWAKRLAVDLLSGLYLPLHFFPDWFQGTVRLLPFQAVAYLPNMIFTGNLRGDGVRDALLLQLFWVGMFTVGISLLWRHARRYLVVQGG